MLTTKKERVASIGRRRGRNHGGPRVPRVPPEVSQLLIDGHWIGDGGIWNLLAGGVEQDIW